MRAEKSSLTRTGIIGGTGLYSLPDVTVIEERSVSTPFGEPSAPLVLAKMGANEVVFLPRHGRHHTILPSEINYRANLWALKSLGVVRVISVSATGSLRQEIRPGDLVLPSQYFDWTRGKRASTFLGEGCVAHISTAEPVCADWARVVKSAADAAKINIHTQKTYACVEGPRLGTRAESFFLRQAGCDLVGMTNLPEAFLALEAQLNYCTLAIATDYDCWRDDPEDHVSLTQVLARYRDALGSVVGVFKKLFEMDLENVHIPRRLAMREAIATPREFWTPRHQEIVEMLCR